MKKYLLLGSVLFFVACGTSKMIIPSQTDVDREKDNYPGLSLTQLRLGEKVYMESCNRCHPFKKPTSRTVNEWKEIIPEMTTKTNRKLGNTIDAEKEAALLQYVSVMSTAQK